MNRKVSGAYTVELIPSGNKFLFPDIAHLRDKKIMYIDLPADGYTPSGNRIHPYGSTYLTLMEANTNELFVESLNLSELNNTKQRIFFNKTIDFQRSFVEKIGDPYPDYTVAFVLWFEEPSMEAFTADGLQNKILPLKIKLTGKKTYFSENINLKEAIFTGLILTQGTIAYDGSDQLNHTDKKFITLVYKNKVIFNQIPIRTFVNFLTYRNLSFTGIKIDLQSSFIEALDTTEEHLKTLVFTTIIDDNKQRR